MISNKHYFIPPRQLNHLRRLIQILQEVFFIYPLNSKNHDTDEHQGQLGIGGGNE